MHQFAIGRAPLAMNGGDPAGSAAFAKGTMLGGGARRPSPRSSRPASTSCTASCPATTPPGSASDLVAELDEPVQRYFAHALGAGVALPARVRLSMVGRIRVGV